MLLGILVSYASKPLDKHSTPIDRQNKQEVRIEVSTHPLTPKVYRSKVETVCVFITAVPIAKLFACVGGETMEDMYYERLRAEACVD